ncbi:MAG: 4-hydroxy-tetrahydrodipicolinate synthase [Flavobacteriaceae bacterium]
MKSLIGTGVALITPFTERGDVDVLALSALVNYQIERDINYLVVLGTTAEAATLTADEKQLVVDTVVEANAKRLPLVLGMGSNNTSGLCEELQTKDLSAFDAILSVSPYYNKPTQEGVYKHFEAVSKASPLPIILYNVPGRTSSNMNTSTVVRLAEDFENIVGIKEAAGDLVQAMNLIKDCPKDFLVISGDDAIALPMTLAGGAGVISVIAQGLPSSFSKMIRQGLNSDVKDAFSLQYEMLPVIDMIFEQGNPAGIKSLLAHLGLIKNTLRLPLVKCDSDLDQRILQFLK